MDLTAPDSPMFSTISDRLMRSFTSIFITCFALLLGGCQTAPNPGSTGSSSNQKSDGEVLRVGVAANMPPFVFEQDGKLVGLEIDFAVALANELGMKVRFVKMKWSDLIPSLRKGKIDIIMSGMNYNREREAIISFTDPYVQSGQKALVLLKNASKYPMAGFIVTTKAKVGAEKATTGAFLVESSFPKASLKTYSSAEKGTEALMNEEIELFIHDAPTAYWMAGLYQNQGVTVAPPVLSQDLMCWGVNLENQQLLNQVNQILAQWSATGAIDSILTRWVRL